MLQPRRIARELALLSLSQMPSTPDKLDAQQMNNLVLAAVRTLTSAGVDVPSWVRQPGHCASSIAATSHVAQRWQRSEWRCQVGVGQAGVAGCRA